MVKFPDDFTKREHPLIPNAIQYTYQDSNGNNMYSIVGGGIGTRGDGVHTFEMFDYLRQDVVLSYAMEEDINEYLSSQSFLSLADELANAPKDDRPDVGEERFSINEDDDLELTAEDQLVSFVLECRSKTQDPTIKEACRLFLKYIYDEETKPLDDMEKKMKFWDGDQQAQDYDTFGDQKI